MAKILGLDLGTNSIGWAVVENEDTYVKQRTSTIYIDEALNFFASVHLRTRTLL
jgi:CRISPR/Cas system Type II protein with McrA/HNH and RuvC-like nuclease domain